MSSWRGHSSPHGYGGFRGGNRGATRGVATYSRSRPPRTIPASDFSTSSDVAGIQATDSTSNGILDAESKQWRFGSLEPRSPNVSAVSPPSSDGLSVSGVPVSFPFTPYPTQIEYMSAVIETLRNKQNALLESPTGTGKTLSLLCSTLAWRQAYFTSSLFQPPRETASHSSLHANSAADQMPSDTKVIFASRTHGQLQQVMQELNRTAYRKVKCGMLGSRDQLCINDRILREGEKSHAKLIRKCKAACSKPALKDPKPAYQCPFFQTLSSMVKNRQRSVSTASDIEEIASKNILDEKGHKVCPFHAARFGAKSADLLFMPYSYLFDMKSGGRSTSLINLRNSVVIIDEGHNIAQTCENAATFEFRVNDILSTAEHLDRLYQYQAKRSGPDSVRNLASVYDSLMMLHVSFSSIPAATTKNPLTLYQLMDRLRYNTDITYSNIRIVLKALDVVLECETEREAEGSSTACIDAVRVALLMLFFPHGLSAGGSTDDDDDDALPNVVDVQGETTLAREFYKSYLVTVADVPTIFSKNKQYARNFPKSDKFVRCFCLSPHNALRSLLNQGVRSLIITSGTLAPMNLLAAELGVQMHLQKTCPHIIKSSQVGGLILSHAPTSTMPSAAAAAVDNEIALKADFTNRDNTTYQLAVGNAIFSVIQHVPAGVLVFFTSYAALDTCLRVWGDNFLLPKIENFKTVFVEERDRDKFCAQLQQFRRICTSGGGKGAILFAVSRAKVSEGIDFPDDCARAVIIVGIPYGHIKDERTQLKKLYLNRIQHDPATVGPTLSGSDWYQRDAWVSINQSIGRVIRHKNDYGVCIFMDERFMDELQRVKTAAAVAGGVGSNLPPYIRDSLDAYTMEGVVEKLKQFFVENEKNREPTAVAVGSSFGGRGGLLPTPPEGGHMEMDVDW